MSRRAQDETQNLGDRAIKLLGDLFIQLERGERLGKRRVLFQRATLTSNTSLSAGPPWNMLGVLSGENRIIDWSNGTQWRKQAPPS